MKVITIYHNKGGVGKTTVTVNLAAALRRQRYRVLVIDIDSQANTTFAVGLMKFLSEEDDTLRDANILHILRNEYFISEVVRRSDSFNDPEIDVIPAHIDLIEFEIADDLRQIDTIQISLLEKLQEARDDYDFVIIDAPPALDTYAQIALVASDYLMIPSDFRPFANQGLKYVKTFVARINQEFSEIRATLGKNQLKIVGILPSKIHGQTCNSLRFRNLQEKIASKYNLRIMETIIKESADLANSLHRVVIIDNEEIPEPQSIFKYKQNSDSASQFENLAQELIWLTRK